MILLFEGDLLFYNIFIHKQKCTNTQIQRNINWFN